MHSYKICSIFAVGMQTLLEIRNLKIGYSDYIVQTDLNLTAHAGEMICMIGKNGCGKSTLLRTLAGLQAALEGDIFFSEEDKRKSLSELSASERSRLLSLVLTERLSLDNTSVHDVVAMGRYPYTSFLGGLTEDDEKEIMQALLQVGIEEKRNKYFNNLSDGEKQRVLIAKALAQETPLILLDEPTSHLDLPNRIRIMLLLREFAHTKQKCIIISTHELDLALQTADRIWLMTPQEGIETGTPQELTSSGAFQKAFQDENFSFVSEGEMLRIKLK